MQGVLKLERMAHAQQFHDQEHAFEYKQWKHLASFFNSLVGQARTRRRMLLDQVLMNGGMPNPEPEDGIEATFDIGVALANSMDTLNALRDAWQTVFDVAAKVGDSTGEALATVALNGGKWLKHNGKKKVKVRGVLYSICDVEVWQAKWEKQGPQVFLGVSA